MKKNCISFLGLALGLAVIAMTVAGAPVWGQLAGKTAVKPLAADFAQFMSVVTASDWQGSGRFFIMMQRVFAQLFIGVPVLMLVLFIVHYLLVGPKSFAHDGEKVFYYSVFCRVVHTLAAISFTVLVLSGLLIILGRIFHGGELVRTARYLHAPAALVFAPAFLVLFLLWVRDMLPAACDLDWLLVLGGYLSRKKTVVVAGKFNLGQKFWFWLAVGGGLVMAYTGYCLFTFSGTLPALRLAAVVHNLLGVLLLVMFMIHLYMALFAIRGSLRSMLTGYKSADEVAQMHSEYWRRIS